jgi:transketolase
MTDDLWEHLLKVHSDGPAKTSRELARRIRLSSLLMVADAQAPHIGSCFSVADILAVLLFESPKASGKSSPKIVLSKGHAAAAYYSALAHIGLLPIEALLRYCQDGGNLKGHVSRSDTPFAPLSTGSLGHGLPFSAGLCFASRLDNPTEQIYVVLSDGELDEGSTWEAALIAAHFELNNLTAIVDRNYLQSLTTTEETLRLEPLSQKFEAFGWSVSDCSGHDHPELEGVISGRSNKPKVVIARTTKGFGVSRMHNAVEWHYKPPSGLEVHEMYAELLRD